jgi:hypothetical protein
MGLLVAAQVIRELITDGEYLVECIEQRERGKVTVAFTLRARAQPYNIQIETMDSKLDGLFRAILDSEPSRAQRAAGVKVGNQPVPILEVESLPLDAMTGNKRRRRQSNRPDASHSHPSNAPKASGTGSRSAGQQLALVPQEGPKAPAPKRTRRQPSSRSEALHEGS